MAKTVMQVLAETADRRGEHPALKHKTDDGWQSISWHDYYQRVRRIGRSLIRLGLEPGKGVAILGFNRPEWFLADLGAIAAGGVPTGIYSTCTPDQCQYIADHCEAQIIVVENLEALEKFRAVRDRLPHLKAMVLMDGSSPDDDVYSWSEFDTFADQVAAEELEVRIKAQRPDDVCTLIYTSGTTGPPKAVMISHHNIVWVSEQLRDHFHLVAEDSLLSYLPLSHIAEQVVSLHAPIVVGACTWFAESLEQLGQNLKEARPHFFFAVPRVWEKLQSGIEAAGAQSSPLKKKIGAWARRQGLAGGYAEQSGRSKPLLYGLANRLVFSTVKEKLGLDRARVCATSAAPISLQTLEFFLSLGIPIYEVYGMSECTGPTTFSTPGRYRTGRAGFAIKGTDLEVAEDGEILMRGPHLCRGYFKDPEATAEAIDAEGWLHSGDIGELDEDGFIKVTDRKKELLITSGGKNIAPQVIEGLLKSIPGVAAAVVIGDRRNYLTALLTLDPDTLAVQAKHLMSKAQTTFEAASSERFRAYLEKKIESVNSNLASFETIKRFKVLPGELTIDGGELTPTMKLKRRVVNEKYADEIDALYA